MSSLTKIRGFAGQAKRRLLRGSVRREVLRHTVHLHGPRQVELDDREVIATLLARDAAWFLPVFLDHHLTLGVSHILVIDNGSNDETLEICRRHARVTMLRNLLPARRHESALRSVLAQSVARGGWILFADADELVEMPISGDQALHRFTGYCNEHGYTAAIGQMLDRFSMEPYRELAAQDYSTAVSSLNWYSLKQLEAFDYYSPQIAERFRWVVHGNRCGDRAVRLHQAGLRKELFGQEPFLSKHALVRNRARVMVQPHPHFATNVKVADVTFLIHHFKFAGDWIARDQVAALEGHWGHGGEKVRLGAIGGDAGEFCLAPTEPRAWRGVETLLEEGFLYASPRFQREMGLSPR